MSITPHLDLRSGQVCWETPRPLSKSGGPLPAQVDVAVVGAGIMGSMLAERLTAAGHKVAVFDRRTPSDGATAGSTALVMWAADTPLTTLSQSIGKTAAAEAWRAVFEACRELDGRIARLGIDCGWTARPEVYLAGGLLDADALQEEAALRQAAGLPSTPLQAEAVRARFGLPDRAALVSTGVFAVDPVALARGLLDTAMARRGALFHPLEIEAMQSERDGVRLISKEGDVLAAHVVLATGYEAVRPDLPSAFSLSSSFAIATAPGFDASLLEEPLIWEASDPYLYARPTADGRLIVGGLDEDDPAAYREPGMLARKAAKLEAAGSRLVGAPIKAACAWGAAFGGSPDGLPAIGESPRDPRIWLSYGFGGNGVTFAALAAGLIARALAGERPEALNLFSPWRAAANTEGRA